MFIRIIWRFKIENIRNVLPNQANGPSYPVFGLQQWQRQMLFTESMQGCSLSVVHPSTLSFSSTHSAGLGFVWW